jgi:nitrite reductase/ring-hydroxylating ferredoxin subunit
MPKYVVAPVEEIPPGTHKIVDVAGRSIGVYNIGGEFFALRNRCPHQGAALCEGRVSGLISSTTPGEYVYTRPGEIVRCPWHGWEYDIRTGQSWFDPRSVRVRAYEVSVAPGAELVSEPGMEGFAKGPYVAETYPVSVEQRYVLVDIAS